MSQNVNPKPSQDVTAAGNGTTTHPDRFVDPGLPEHKPRLADIDPKAAKRNERIVVLLFVLSILGTIGTVVAYFAVRPDGTTAGTRLSTVLLGVGMAVSLLGLGFGAVHWAKTLMSNHEHIEERHDSRSSDEVRTVVAQAFKDGYEDSGLPRRGVLKGAVVSALALFPLTIAVPLVSSVGGDWNVGKFRHTLWKTGTRLAYDPSGRPIKAADLTVGSVAHVIPDVDEEMRESHEWITEKSKAVVLLVRLNPQDLKADQSPEGETWSYDGIVAYSKICTHVGCPVALYEQQTHHLLCPCHQSTFDISDGAKVVFGPANRPLPQLPITVDDEGYLVAQDDFAEPIGPSYWERLK
ncbi:ubiquinol-cytochrome c reductase iron-sulfur subunit [Isoptericola variabilis]|uniref:Cytochrome bc1 complex Rieske iron-sulfur subunit n=1 Tax=Isoptericola variabilis (strain 225) TaxID=743718 RepID=F6FWJ7_ISOV2|nr:Rieske 2Fe-2S domain-containing protein [Isoptericola variabilis]AEG44571.1 Rieske (2Fe-2S) iron-sulfur domain protein [Isoptericola variabilis 225]TWH28929.1 ubiquinol-cytochrome c reductase iron-sulfur subunit [Isoptericola variabilis J7]